MNIWLRDATIGAKVHAMRYLAAIFIIITTACMFSASIAQAETYRFTSVKIEGNERIEPQTILTYAGIGKGVV